MQFVLTDFEDQMNSTESFEAFQLIAAQVLQSIEEGLTGMCCSSSILVSVCKSFFFFEFVLDVSTVNFPWENRSI